MFKIFRYLKKKDWFYILIGVALIVFQVWLEITMTRQNGKLTGAISIDPVDMSSVWIHGGIMLACAAGSLIGSIICGYFISTVAANFAKNLRLALFDKVASFGNREINTFSTPSLITRTTNDVVQMQMMIAMGLQVAIKAPVTAIWAICDISGTNLEWTTAVVLTIITIVVMFAIIIGLCYPRFKKIQKLTDDLNEITRENISGVRVIRAYNADEYQAKKFEKVNDAVTKNHLFTARVMGLMMPVINLCMNGLRLAIYWISALLMNGIVAESPQDISFIAERLALIEQMTQFLQQASLVVGAFMMLIMIFVMLPRTLVSAKRINEVLDTVPSITYPDADPTTDKRGEIEFKDVSFAYPDGKEACIENINFKIKQGETFAIIGATGSGKSTIINLIPRFFDATQGEILLDGVNIKNYKKDTLQKMVSIAPQKAALFKGSIKSNVTYGADGDAANNEERIMRALKIAKADFVDDLKDGVDSAVAQGGTNFSGGQKQRLSIARAVFKDAEIMIFDDTFSALDYKTDMLVRKAVKENLQGTTVIIVAQRIGTIKNADQILVLDKGQVVGLGKHEDLLKNCPTYNQIALSQLSKEEL